MHELKKLEDAANQSEILKKQVLSKIQRCLTDYDLTLSGPVILGLSGGKDSTALLLLLRDLKIDTIPVVVDMGYANFDAHCIAFSLTRYGITPRIISAKDCSVLRQLSNKVRSKVLSNLSFVASPNGVTPCGACSQIKRTLLMNEAKNSKAQWIALGHHREDFLATILKDYFVQIYYPTMGKYNTEAFRNFIQSVDIDFDKLEDFIDSGLAATMAVRVRLTNRIDLVRPMAYVREIDIIKLIHLMGIKTLGSGCSHEVFNSTGPTAVTKREIVHEELRQRLQESPELGDKLLAITLNSLDKNGHVRFNPRSARNKLLPGFA